MVLNFMGHSYESKCPPVNVIYLDYHATTPVDRRVAEKVLSCMTDCFGNASSTDHARGDRARAAIDHAKHQIASLIQCQPQEIIFTSGATESLNLAIQGTVIRRERHRQPTRIAISSVEHKAVLDLCQTLHHQGRIQLRLIPVDDRANLDLQVLETYCQEGLDLLGIMAANNEVGTIYPLETLGEMAQHYQIPFLCDASQAVGKIPLKFQDWNLSLLAFSGHKLYAPQGIGVLIKSRDYPLDPLLYGGGHQQGLRSGTLNLPGIVGLGEACALRQQEMAIDEPRIAQQRNTLQAQLQQAFPDLVVNGNPDNRLAGNLHCSLGGIPNSAVTARLYDRLAISSGSACSSGTIAQSHVLRAMGLPDETIEGALRIGLGKFTTDEEVQAAAHLLIDTLKVLQTLLA
jgi:cysteine desulfurase